MTVRVAPAGAMADADHAAIRAACEPGTALCTIVGIDGSFSRRVGAQLAVKPDGATIGSLSDNCLEAQLSADASAAVETTIVRYGAGSGKIDFRLPCGSGLDILIDPSPDRAACAGIVSALEERKSARLALPAPSPIPSRSYIPELELRVFGEGPELSAVGNLTKALDLRLRTFGKDDLRLGHASGLPPADRWTAILFLFHDHEWENALIEEALDSGAFYIGAQGGENARIARSMALLSLGVSEERLARLRSPVGAIASCKTPQSLALSCLAEIVGEYERLCDAS